MLGAVSIEDEIPQEIKDFIYLRSANRHNKLTLNRVATDEMSTQEFSTVVSVLPISNTLLGFLAYDTPTNT